MEARLMTLLWKKIVSKSKKMKTGGDLAESSEKDYGPQKGCFADVVDDDGDKCS
jgi:hypothetical protein